MGKKIRSGLKLYLVGVLDFVCERNVFALDWEYIGSRLPNPLSKDVAEGIWNEILSDIQISEDEAEQLIEERDAIVLKLGCPTPEVLFQRLQGMPVHLKEALSSLDECAAKSDNINRDTPSKKQKTLPNVPFQTQEPPFELKRHRPEPLPNIPDDTSTLCINGQPLTSHLTTKPRSLAILTPSQFIALTPASVLALNPTAATPDPPSQKHLDFIPVDVMPTNSAPPQSAAPLPLPPAAPCSPTLQALKEIASQPTTDPVAAAAVPTVTPPRRAPALTIPRGRRDTAGGGGQGDSESDNEVMLLSPALDYQAPVAPAPAALIALAAVAAAQVASSGGDNSSS